ncbi:MFS transporter [Actinoplanes sp. NBRC 14428]|uniref:Transmembrane secretion effector n=1 Tax=Pseudosporangium ferrugineum TaxID=439699 RepID=A0A2T0SB13_9ACTN|nr:MFS transporter [Pseudosporangium ferrugineum]PRY30571.1 transmembrane secretion effector [Pseudosporangium ferrugineum]BCJ50108.1 MFS transporter [Actinoplanes sp. NBRC 14428]
MRWGPASYLFASGAAASLGDGIRYAAMPLLAVHVTRDPVSVAAVAAALSAAHLLFGFHVGAAVDRFDRVRLLRRTQLFRAVLIVALLAAVALDRATLPLLLAAAFLLGAAELAAETAVQSLTPVVVQDAGLERLNAGLTASQSIGEDFAGPAAGGVLFAWHPVAPFAAIAAAIGGSWALLTRLRVPGRVPAGPAPAAPVRTSLTAEAREGLRYLMREPTLRLQAVWAAAMNLGVAAANATLVLYVVDELHLGGSTYGLLLTGAGVGGLAGAAAVSWTVRALGRVPTMIAASLVAGVVTAGIAATGSVWLIVAFQFLAGFSGVSFSIVGRSLRQSITPDALMGRVTSIYRLIGFGSLPLGAIGGGAVAHGLGLGTPFLLAGAVMVGSTLTLGLMTRRAHVALAAREPAAR